MTTLSTTAPVWAQAPFMRAVWVATSESPEWIAARTDGLLDRLGSAFDITSWHTENSERWEGPPEVLAGIVRRSVVRDRPTADDPDGEAIPENGYFVSVSGVGRSVDLTVRVSAGGIAVGRRHPSHYLSINLRETVVGALSSEVGDGLCSIVAQGWKPSTINFSDTPAALAARQSGWKIGVGYRTWISSQVGLVSRVADGLTSSELAGGTMISAPDDWPAERVVGAMTETLAANGLDEVPH